MRLQGKTAFLTAAGQGIMNRPARQDTTAALESMCCNGPRRKENAALVASSRPPCTSGMMAPPTMAITRPAAPNLVAGPRPVSATP